MASAKDYGVRLALLESALRLSCKPEVSNPTGCPDVPFCQLFKVAAHRHALPLHRSWKPYKPPCRRSVLISIATMRL